MGLVVVGDSIERSLPVAAVAALTSGERVSFTSDEDLGELALEVEGTGLSGKAVIRSIHPDATVDADSFIVAAPAKDLDGIFAARPEQYAGKPVLLAPGGFAGALVNAERFRKLGQTAPRFSEAPGWIAGGHLDGGRLRMTMRKRNLDIAGASDEDTAYALEHFGRFVPDLVAADLLTTSLSNINALIHPPIAILNATRMENAEEWCYWDEGLTPGVHRLMEAIDRERLSILEALHGKPVDLLGIALAAYGENGLKGDTFYRAVKEFPSYRNRRGPATLDSRFLTDDVPNGIAAYEQLAETLGLKHPALTAVRVISEVILGRELKADATAVAALVAYAKQRKTAGVRAGRPRN